MVVVHCRRARGGWGRHGWAVKIASVLPASPALLSRCVRFSALPGSVVPQERSAHIRVWSMGASGLGAAQGRRAGRQLQGAEEQRCE